jgi:UDP-N-acetylglucosamine 2-epimerase (non-hydrolysing)
MEEKKKIVVIAGTRPEFIKLASTIKAIEDDELNYDLTVIHTGQHLDMVDDILNEFNIVPSYKLNACGQSLSEMSSYLMFEISKILELVSPDLVIVQGDTLSTFIGAYCAFIKKIKVMHLEAGARSFNKSEPFPEEGMRLMVDEVSDYHLCQCDSHLINLENENKQGEKFIIGNTALDALKLMDLSLEKTNNILITMHRRENWNKVKDFTEIVKHLAKIFYDYTFTFVVHPNPAISDVVKEELSDIENIEVKTHLTYGQFTKALAQAHAVITDSGGVSQ